MRYAQRGWRAVPECRRAAGDRGHAGLVALTREAEEHARAGARDAARRLAGPLRSQAQLLVSALRTEMARLAKSSG